jgi:clan AA aspartic protease (TIGR02281 family)
MLMQNSAYASPRISGYGTLRHSTAHAAPVPRPKPHGIERLFAWLSAEKWACLFLKRRPGKLLNPALAAAVLLAGCQAAPPPGVCKMGLATDLALFPKAGHALTPAKLNDAPAMLILDTGAQFTTITRTTADRLNLAVMPTNGSMGGLGGVRSVYLFDAASFQIGRLQGHDLRLLMSEIVLSPDGSVDGLLGSDFLANYNIDLDFPEHKARLFKVLEGCVNPAAPLDPPLLGAPLATGRNPQDLRPFVNVQIAGKTFRAAVDTGAPSTLMFSNAARRLGLDPEKLTADQHFLAAGPGPSLRAAVRHVISPMTIGDVTVSNMPIAIADQPSFDTDMLLGLDFLTRVHVFLSFSSHTMLMQLPPRPSQPVGE